MKSTDKYYKTKKKWREDHPDFFKNWEKNNPTYFKNRYIRRSNLFASKAQQKYAALTTEEKHQLYLKRKAYGKQWRLDHPDYHKEYYRMRMAENEQAAGKELHEKLKELFKLASSVDHEANTI